MNLRLVHTSADGTRIYHDQDCRIAAIVGNAAAILDRCAGYRDFDVYAVPGPDHRFVLARFDLDVAHVAEATGCGDEPLQPLSRAALAERTRS